jgi:hypothetical protein
MSASSQLILRQHIYWPEPACARIRPAHSQQHHAEQHVLAAAGFCVCGISFTPVMYLPLLHVCNSMRAHCRHQPRCLLLLLLPQTAVDDAPVDTVVPGSVPVTGTYSKTEAEYRAAMGVTGGGLDSVSERTSSEVVEEHPVQVGVAEVGVRDEACGRRSL